MKDPLSGSRVARVTLGRSPHCSVPWEQILFIPGLLCVWDLLVTVILFAVYSKPKADSTSFLFMERRLRFRNVRELHPGPVSRKQVSRQ